MNIIKLKDINKPNDEIFNNNFRGRYCYVIRWKDIISLDVNKDKVYIYEREGLDESIQHLSLSEYNTYIDYQKTDEVNDISCLLEYNKNISDISINEIKKFRTWLSKTLLNIFINSDDTKLKVMLSYYANCMKNNTVDELNMFSSVNMSINNISSSNKCCNNTTDVNNLFNKYSCNPIESYKDGIYKHMIQTFSNIDFWNNINHDLLNIIKKYIDSIVKTNLSLYTPLSNNILYKTCDIFEYKDTQENRQEILKNLSKSFKYIIDNDINGNRNFIYNTLNLWSTLLYEHMEWN